MKKFVLQILKYILVFIILISTYFLGLSLISKIPSNLMKENVKQSATYFINNGGEKQIIDLKYKKITLFNFTNALMINTAYSIDSSNPVESFLTAKKNFIPGITNIIHTETSKSLMSASKYYENGIFNGNAYQTIELYDTVNENDLYESFEYARYWHGYLIYLRPLLVLFNYSQISIILLITFIGLLIICSSLIWKKIGKFPAISLVLSCLFFDLFFVAKSINEIICFDLALIFSIYILLSRKDKKNIFLNFFVIGSITNFIDFLTNPIVVYGIPIIIYFMLEFKENKLSFKEIFFIYLKTSILWFLGYSLTWLSKWIITDILLDRNIVQNAIEQIKFRTDTGSISKIDFISHLNEFVSGKIWMSIYVTAIILFFTTLRNIRNKKCKEKINYRLITYIISLFIPIVWYFVLLQHSYIHMFFTYRNSIIINFAIYIIVLEITNSIYDQKNN